MFDNIGSKIKGTAVALFIIGELSTFACAIAYESVLIGVLGFVGSWLGTFTLYGFGELISSTMTLNGQMDELLDQMDVVMKDISAIRENTFE